MISLWPMVLKATVVVPGKNEGAHELSLLILGLSSDKLQKFRVPYILFVVVQLLSHAWLFVNSWTAAHQASHPSPSPRACWNSCLLSLWRHPTISASVIPFCSCFQSFPALGSFPVSQFFASGGQSIGASASASILPINIQDRFPSFDLLIVKGLSRVFSNTTV